MAITDVTSALEIINKIVEADSVEIETPISRNVYLVTPLQGEDDIVLKKSTKSNAEYIENLVKVIYKHLKQKDGNFISFDDFIKQNSMNDLSSLIYGVLCATYKEEKEFTFTCTQCNSENKLTNVKYSEFKLKGKKWDKDVPFYKYSYEIVIPLSDKLTLKFITKIPNIYENIQIAKFLNKDFNPNETFLDIPLIDYMLIITEKFIIESKVEKEVKNKDGSIQKVSDLEVKEYSNVHDLKILFEKMPEYILSNVKDEYVKHFNDYVAYYVLETNCNQCGAKNELVLNPEITLLSRVFGG